MAQGGESEVGRAECSGPGKGTSGSRGWAVQLIRPRKEYVQLGRAGSAGPTGPGSPPGAPTAEKQTHSLCPSKDWGYGHPRCRF